MPFRHDADTLGEQLFTRGGRRHQHSRAVSNVVRVASPVDGRSAGVRLRHLVKDTQAGREHMRLLVPVAAKLHQCPLIPGAPMKVAQLLALCKPRPQRLAQKFPALAAPIQYLIEAAPRIEQKFTQDIYRPVHGAKEKNGRLC